MRWRSDEYDRLWTAARGELDAVRRAALFIRMNDLVVEDAAVITVEYRSTEHALSRYLQGVDVSPYDSTLHPGRLVPRLDVHRRFPECLVQPVRRGTPRVWNREQGDAPLANAE
jgi:hypothetical protein